MSLVDDVIDSVIDLERPIDDVRVGRIYSAVRIGDRVGLAYNPGGWDYVPENVGDLIGTKAVHLARSWNYSEASIGTAAINALIEPPKGHAPVKIFDYVEEKIKSYQRVAFIGFMPVINRLKKSNDDQEIFVFEMTASHKAPYELKLYFKDDIPYKLLPGAVMGDVLPTCDIVIITGATFVNHSLEGILNLSGGYNLVYGPSVPILPVLFDYGVDLIGGTVISDPEKALLIVSQGGGAPPVHFQDTLHFICVERK